MNIYLDIETVPAQDPRVIERLTANVKPPANYTKPDTIKKWWASQGEAAKDEAIRKTALDGGRGQIFCIGYAVGTDEISVCVDDESAMLGTFYKAIAGEGYHGYELPFFIGHYVTFDLKFLWQRSVINNIRPPVKLPWQKQPWHGDYYDTMHAWSGNKDWVKLDELCDILGIETDDEIDGSQVWDAIQSGDSDKVIEHCRADVEKVRAIHQRLL